MMPSSRDQQAGPDATLLFSSEMPKIARRVRPRMAEFYLFDGFDSLATLDRVAPSGCVDRTRVWSRLGVDATPCSETSNECEACTETMFRVQR